MEENEACTGDVESPWWDTGTLSDIVKEYLAEGGESARTYLRESWLAASMQLLRHTRRRTGRTQQEIANALGTSQPAIARLERSDDTTLSRFWDYLYACGKAPGEIETVSAAGLRKYVHANPDAPRKISAIRLWLAEETTLPAMGDDKISLPTVETTMGEAILLRASLISLQTPGLRSLEAWPPTERWFSSASRTRLLDRANTSLDLMGMKAHHLPVDVRASAITGLRSEEVPSPSQPRQSPARQQAAA